MRLKIGDDFLDHDASIIAQTYSVNEIGSVETRQGGFSNNFTLPLTARNKDLLNYPEDINTGDRSAYKKIDACLYDGETCIGVGYLKYQVVFNSRSLQVSFFADNVNWFNLIKGKSLKDLKLEDYTHDWNANQIEDSFTNSDGYIYPLIDYGAWQTEVSSASILLPDRYNWMPAVFVKTVIEQIFFDIGWKVEGKMTELDIYKRMLHPFSQGELIAHSPDWIEDNSYDDTVNGPHAVNTSASSIPWVTAGSGAVVWPNKTAKVIVKLTLDVSGTGPIEVFVSRGDGFNSDVEEIGTPSGTETHVLYFKEFDNDVPLAYMETAYNLSGRDEFRARVRTTSGTATVVSGTLEIIAQPEYEYTTDVHLADVLPDMEQADFIREVAFRFGAVPQANVMSKTVSFDLFRDIKKNLGSAVDWSGKIDTSLLRQLNFTEFLNKYGQKSLLKEEDADDDPGLASYKASTGKTFGQGAFNLSNEHLPGEVVFFNSEFTPTINDLNGVVPQIVLPRIPMIQRTPGTVATNATYDFINVGLRFLILGISLVDIVDLTSNARTGIQATDFRSPSVISSYSSVPYAWYEKGTTGLADVDADLNTLAFESSEVEGITGTPLKERFLEDYELILNSMRYLKAWFHLNEQDVAGLDFITPVYLDHFKAYFYISKIENFRGRHQLTPVEMVKIA